MGIISWKAYNKDIKSNGDFILENNDLKITSNSIELMLSIVRERFLTAAEDLAYLPTYGSDIQSLKGKGIDESLLNQLKFKLNYSLTYDDFIPSQDLTIVCVSKGNRVDIYTGIKYDNEEILVRATYFDDGSINIE